MNLMEEVAQTGVLREILIKGAVKRELITTNEYIRRVGKTTALIEFAKEFGLNVLVRDRTASGFLRNIHHFNWIYTTMDHLPDGGYVVDEHVDISKVNVEIVTGFKFVRI